MRTPLVLILFVFVSWLAITIANAQTNKAPANDNPLSGLNLGDSPGADISKASTASTFPWSPVIPNNLGTQYSTGFDEQDAHAIGHDLGARWLRIECGWSNVETVKGTYNFASIDKLTSMLLGQGLDPIIIFDYGNALYQTIDGKADPFCGPTTLEAQQGYANYCGAVAAHLTQRFPNHAFVYELWNEPNFAYFWHPTPDAKAYTQLCKLAYPAIKQAAPNCVVLGPATSSAHDPFIDDCIDRGLLDAIDAVSVHPYRGSPPETVIQDYDALHRLIASHNKNAGHIIPLVCSEWGYNATEDNANGISCDPKLQAPYLARMWLIGAWKDIGISIWFQWRSGLDNDAKPWAFGMVRQDRSPRPSYTAAKTLIDTLRGYSCTGRINVASKDDYVLRFENPATGGMALAAWTTGDPHTGRALWPWPNSENGALVTMLGERSAIARKDDRIELPLSSSPVYAISAKP